MRRQAGLVRSLQLADLLHQMLRLLPLRNNLVLEVVGLPKQFLVFVACSLEQTYDGSRLHAGRSDDQHCGDYCRFGMHPRVNLT